MRANEPGTPEKNGGFETLTNISIEQLGCQGCHAPTYADGSPVDPATYQPGCRDCHVQPGDAVSQQTCFKCHGRQQLEKNLYSDVHRENNLECSDCHTGKDVHGNGKVYKSWLEAGGVGVTCEKCHGSIPTTPSHAIHAEEIDCAVCHAQSVLSCYNCHLDSTVANHATKRQYGPMEGFVFLVNRPNRGKIYSATVMTLVHNGKTFMAVAPFRGHTITKTGRTCAECQNNAVVQEYKKTGKITISRWYGTKLVFTQGVIPVPPDWRTSFVVDFLNHTGDPANPHTDPTKWVFLKTGADLLQMLYAEPLTSEQMEKLKEPHCIPYQKRDERWSKVVSLF